MLPAGARWRPAGSGRAPPVERLVTVWVLTRRRARRAPAEPPPRARACCRPRPVPPGLLAARLNAFVRLPVRPAQTTALAVAIPAYQAEPEPWHVEVSMPCARVAPTLLHAGWTHAPRPAWLTAAGSRLSRTGCRRLPPDHVRQHAVLPQLWGTGVCVHKGRRLPRAPRLLQGLVLRGAHHAHPAPPAPLPNSATAPPHRCPPLPPPPSSPPPSFLAASLGTQG